MNSRNRDTYLTAPIAEHMCNRIYATTQADGVILEQLLRDSNMHEAQLFHADEFPTAAFC